jgi:hypothetical protein
MVSRVANNTAVCECVSKHAVLVHPRLNIIPVPLMSEYVSGAFRNL